MGIDLVCKLNNQTNGNSKVLDSEQSSKSIILAHVSLLKAEFLKLIEVGQLHFSSAGGDEIHRVLLYRYHPFDGP